MAINRGNMPGLKPTNAPCNNLERGSNIFVTSNMKQKEEDSLHLSKLSRLISNNEKPQNDSKNEVSLLQHKRLLAESNPADTRNIGAK